MGGGLYGLEGEAGVERDLVAGERLETVEEGWVKGEAQTGEGAKLWGIVRIVGGKHAGGCGGGFGEGNGAVEDGDAGSAVVELKGKGEADDAGSGDTYVGAFQLH